MKIVRDDCVYVQRIDIADLFRENLLLSRSIFSKVFGENNVSIDDMYSFIKFDDPKVTAYFKQMDCIVDYDEVKDLSPEQIMELGKNIEKQRNDIRKRLDSSHQFSDRNMMMHYKLLNFKVRSLCDAYKLKNGSIKIKLPKEIRESDDSSSSLRNGIKKFTKSIFRNKKGKTDDSRLD